MPHPSDKITIGPDELAPPPAERITIRAADLPAEVPPQRKQEAAIEAVLVPEKPASALPVVAWVGLTLVPLLNIWVYWRFAPHEQPKRLLCRAAACVLGILHLFAAAAAAVSRKSTAMNASPTSGPASIPAW